MQSGRVGSREWNVRDRSGSYVGDVPSLRDAFIGSIAEIRTAAQAILDGAFEHAKYDFANILARRTYVETGEERRALDSPTSAGRTSAIS